MEGPHSQSKDYISDCVDQEGRKTRNKFIWGLRNYNSGETDSGKTERIFRVEEAGAYKGKSHKAVKNAHAKKKKPLATENNDMLFGKVTFYGNKNYPS